MLYFYGVRLALESIAGGRFSREALKNLIVPENYWRTLENRLTFDELGVSASDRVLDVGSPKLLSLFIADRLKAEVYATDIESYFVNDYAAFRRQRGIQDTRFHALEADGRHLPFPDGHFSRAYSMSVLEHIPERGDSECVKEIARTLAPGGVFVLTVPFAPVSAEEFKNPESFYWSGNSGEADGTSKRFFQRRYSERDLHERLILPSGLRLRKVEYLGDRVALSNGSEISRYLPPLTGPIQPLLSRIFHESPSASWTNLKKPLGALVVLEKP